jgi:polyribonucleotide nucleotidyltransferase
MLESHKKLLVALCIWMLILSEVAFAKTYQRKSISYINTLWLATPEARKISSAQAEELLSNIKKEMAMERFDYNPLPDDLVQKFVQEAKKAEALTLEQIVELLEETVVPAIIKVLNENMEVRAKELISEEERNSFIALKAKELGLTAEHFEKVLNSAYMYMPVLTNYSRSVSK